MAINVWQPGFYYLDEALVLPTQTAGATTTVIPNDNFESGDTDWTKGTGWAINQVNSFTGTWSAEYNANGVAIIEQAVTVSVKPGKAITAKAFIATADVAVSAVISLVWYDASDVYINTSSGNSVSSGSITTWQESTVSAVAPANAAKVAIGVTATGDGINALYADNLRWNYVEGTAPTSLAYKNVSVDGAGTSGSVEPTWPTVIGNTVVDNEITWEAVETDSVTWEASSILTSGNAEPTWPTQPNAFVADNNIAWETIPFRITDENCPHSRVVAIAASKVFAGDTDVVRFCATLNARDWSSDDDAGFIPSGLQQKGEIGVTSMGVYRGNLAIWAPSNFQIWQVDPDPAAMQLLDSMEGIGSSWQQAVTSVNDDCFFLSTLGVRTVAIAEGTNNLATGDVGIPIDELVQAEMYQPDVEPIATYFPSGGQWWLAFRPLTLAAGLLAGQFLLTTPVYPISYVDATVSGGLPTRGTLYAGTLDATKSGGTPRDSTLEEVLLRHTLDPDAVKTGGVPTQGELYGDLIDIQNYEDATKSGGTPQDSTLTSIPIIIYTHPPEEEGFQSGGTPQDSTLT